MAFSKSRSHSDEQGHSSADVSLNCVKSTLIYFLTSNSNFLLQAYCLVWPLTLQRSFVLCPSVTMSLRTSPFYKDLRAQKSCRWKRRRLQTCPGAVNTQTNSDLQNSWMASGEPECVIFELRWNPQLMSWATKYAKSGEPDDAQEDLCLCYVRQEEWPPRDMKARRKTAGPRAGFPFPLLGAGSPVIVSLVLYFFFLMVNQQQSSGLIQMWFESHLGLHLVKNGLRLNGGGGPWRLERPMVCLFIQSAHPDPLHFFPHFLSNKTFHKQLLTQTMFRLIWSETIRNTEKTK